MIIGLTGRIAAGKGQVVSYLLKRDYTYCTFSDVVREEAATLGMEITRKNLQDLGNARRREFGAGYWAQEVMKRMKSENYIVDGIRNPAEVEELRKMKDFYLVAIDAPRKIRFERVVRRAKPSDPKTWEGFLEMDERDFGKGEPEDGQQVGLCMKLADFHLDNNSTLEEFNNQIEQVYSRITSSSS